MFKHPTRLIAIGSFLALLMALLAPSNALAATPGAPTGLAGIPGDKQVALTWTAPAVTGGGGGISDYIIEYSTDGALWYQFFDATSATASVTVTGLVNATPYYFRVSAVNAADRGVASTYITATPFVVHTANDPAKYSACPTGSIPVAGFTDTTSTSVDCVKYYNITKGTTATTYSPQDEVTRWQMALFLTRMVTASGATLPSGTAQGFSDISNYSSEIKIAINQLKQLGITIGKTATTYAPADNVTREEMALFITRLLKASKAGPGANEEFVAGSSGVKEIKSNDTDHNFTDINRGTMDARNAIINLWNLGVTDAQLLTTYEPLLPMTRKSMAVFMANALAHTNARPAGLVIQASTYRAPGSPSVYFSVTHRGSNLAAISGSSVDVFKYTIPGVTTVAKFDAFGYCKDTLAASISNTMCFVDTLDPKTDASGNLAEFWEVMPSASKQEIQAWTNTPTTRYDNDLHGATASMVTVETHM